MLLAILNYCLVEKSSGKMCIIKAVWVLCTWRKAFYWRRRSWWYDLLCIKPLIELGGIQIGAWPLKTGLSLWNLQFDALTHWLPRWVLFATPVDGWQSLNPVLYFQTRRKTPWALSSLSVSMVHGLSLRICHCDRNHELWWFSALEPCKTTNLSRDQWAGGDGCSAENGKWSCRWWTGEEMVINHSVRGGGLCRAVFERKKN